MIQIYPQGDCILIRLGYAKSNSAKGLKKIPKDAKKQKTSLVLKGTTNSHALFGGKFEIFKTDKPDANGIDTFVSVKNDTILSHVKDLKTMEQAEHLEQIIEKGLYLIQPLFETDHIKKEQRRVID